MASRGVNKVILVGNVGQDPEFKALAGGKAVCNISIATSEVWKDKSSGEQQEKTEWHRVVFFDKLAEIVEKYVRKGSKLYVEGRLQTRSWEQDGVKRYTTEIVSNEMQMLDSKPSGSASNQSQRGAEGSATNPFGSTEKKPAPGNFDNFDDDIPF